MTWAQGRGDPGEVDGGSAPGEMSTYKNRLRGDQIHVYNPRPPRVLFQSAYHGYLAVFSSEGSWKEFT